MSFLGENIVYFTISLIKMSEIQLKIHEIFKQLWENDQEEK
jgi:hypothetical protein